MVAHNLFAQLEELGLQQVKNNLAMGKCGQVGSEHHNAVSSWVKLQEDSLASIAAANRDAREEETLSIAKKTLFEAKAANDIARTASFAATAAAAAISEANEISRSNRRIAITAAIISAVAAIAAIVAAIAAVKGVK